MRTAIGSQATTGNISEKNSDRNFPVIRFGAVAYLSLLNAKQAFQALGGRWWNRHDVAADAQFADLLHPQ